MRNCGPIRSSKTVKSNLSTWLDFLGRRIDQQAIPFRPRSLQNTDLCLLQHFATILTHATRKLFRHLCPTSCCNNIFRSRYSPTSRCPVYIYIYPQQLTFLILINSNHTIYDSVKFQCSELVLVALVIGFVCRLRVEIAAFVFLENRGRRISKIYIFQGCWGEHGQKVGVRDQAWGINICLHPIN